MAMQKLNDCYGICKTEPSNLSLNRDGKVAQLHQSRVTVSWIIEFHFLAEARLELQHLESTGLLRMVFYYAALLQGRVFRTSGNGFHCAVDNCGPLAGHRC